MCLYDGDHDFTKELDLLMSWGVEVREVIPNVQRVFCPIKYLLHDTKRVRDTLQWIDYVTMRKQADHAQDMLKLMPKSGFEFHALIRQPNGDMVAMPMVNREIIVRVPTYPKPETL